MATIETTRPDSGSTDVPPHRLVCLSSYMKGLSFSIEKDRQTEFILGRLNGPADLTFNDGSISSKHCVLARTSDGSYVLRDLGSLNGTSVNGQRISQDAFHLTDGDVISMGSFEVLYRASGKFHYSTSDRHLVTIDATPRQTQRVIPMPNLGPFTHRTQDRAAKGLVTFCVIAVPVVGYMVYKLVVQFMY